MFNTADDVRAYHDEQIRLPGPERTEMRKRRDSNRDRLKNGLSKADKPAARFFQSQGSYAMLTMVQDDAKDYDIDDGVYFYSADLVGTRGAAMSALQARQMVRDAVDDGSFATPPAVRENCVRVYYQAGYHVDLPVYRRIVKKDFLGKDVVYYELAGSQWKRSDARSVTSWYDAESLTQSPDHDDGGQVRRVTRDLKMFARSRSSWRKSILSGFGISKLVTECFVASAGRDDIALRDTMRKIRDRLERNLEIEHPCTPGETITKEQDDPKARFFKEKLSDALGWLDVLDDYDCTREQALKAWDKVFATDFFIARLDEQSDDASAKSASVLTAGMIREQIAGSNASNAVRKEGGGRYA